MEDDYTNMHADNMHTPKVSDVPKLLQAIMDKTGLKQEGVADRLKVDQPQISRWIRGTKPNGENFEQIVTLARTTGVIVDLRSEDVAASLSELPPPKKVKLKGYVGAGDAAHYYALADEDFEEVPAPDRATDKTVAVEIRGKSLGPLLESWLVYYDDVRSPVTEDLHGVVCVVGLSDDRILIKKIVRNGNGRYKLISNGVEPDIDDADIEWAARVTDMRPRP